MGESVTKKIHEPGGESSEVQVQQMLSMSKALSSIHDTQKKF